MKTGWIMAALVAGAMCCASCIDNVFEQGGITGAFGSKDVKLTGVLLGYNETMDYDDKGFKLDDNVLVWFNSKESIDEMLAKYPDKDLDSTNVIYFNKGICPVKFKPKPEGAMINSWTLVSSNPDIIEVTDYKSLGIEKVLGLDEAVLNIKGVGDCYLTLSASGKNDVSVDYPVRVMSKTVLKFKCTPFWLGCITTRIHWRCKDVPSNVKDVVFKVTDSVRVIGEVSYYDHRKYGRAEQIERDTVYYVNETFYSRFKKDTYHMLRNVTSGVREFKRRDEVRGTRLDWNSNTRVYDTVDVKYAWKAKQVECVFGIVSDNPYLVFDYIVVPGKSYDEKDKDGNIVDAGKDGEEKDTSNDTVLEDISTYFKMSLNDGLTAAQRDSIRNAVNQTKNEFGYDADNLTDSEKNGLIDKMNNEKNRLN